MNDKIKPLYVFTINKQEEIDETTQSTNEAGEVIKITKKVKKLSPHDFCLKKPNSAMTNAADLFYHSTVNEGIRAGLMSTAFLAKTIGKDDGNLTEEERTKGRELLNSWWLKETELTKVEEDLKTAPNNEDLLDKQNKLKKEISEIKTEIQFLEMRQHNLFESSAEARARKRLLAWWMLNLPHKKENGVWKPLFEGNSLTEKEDFYDSFEESFVSDEDRVFFTELLKEISTSVSLWLNGQASKQEDFDRAKKTDSPDKE